jgi:hypothetical protein
MLHPSDSLSNGAISDGYMCAWLNSLPPCTVIVIAQVIHMNFVMRMSAGSEISVHVLAVAAL